MLLGTVNVEFGNNRFENKSSVLWDCLEHLHDEVSESEARARMRIIEVCREIIDENNITPFDYIRSRNLTVA